MNGFSVVFEPEAIERMMRAANQTFNGEVPAFALPLFAESFIREREGKARIGVERVSANIFEPLQTGRRYTVNFWSMPKQTRGTFTITMEVFHEITGELDAIIQLDYARTETVEVAS